MDRRGFDDILNTLNAFLRESALRFFQERSVPFDVDAYRAQSSFSLDDCSREMLIFGANLAPSMDEPIATAVTIAA